MLARPAESRLAARYAEDRPSMHHAVDPAEAEAFGSATPVFHRYYDEGVAGRDSARPPSRPRAAARTGTEKPDRAGNARRSLSAEELGGEMASTPRGGLPRLIPVRNGFVSSR
jgi:hypothetical protein